MLQLLDKALGEVLGVSFNHLHEAGGKHRATSCYGAGNYLLPEVSPGGPVRLITSSIKTRKERKATSISGKPTLRDTYVQWEKRFLRAGTPPAALPLVKVVLADLVEQGFGGQLRRAGRSRIVPGSGLGKGSGDGLHLRLVLLQLPNRSSLTG